MSDLNTEIKIGADASGVEAGVSKAKRSLKDLGDAASRAGKDAGAGIGSIGAGGDKSAKDVERATRSMQGSLQRLLAEQKAGAKGSREYWEALANARGVNKSAIKPILDQLDAAKAKTLSAKAASESWTSSLSKIGPVVAAAFSGAAAVGFVGKLVAVQREFDVLNSSLKTVTGSSEAAEREMAWLKDFAKTTPFGLAQATQGFVKMKALGLDPTRAALTSFGNTASAMGKGLDQMIEAVADASTGEFERLKEFGIKAKKDGDSVSLTFKGVTTTIGNSAREITKYLEDIGNTSFGGAMEERAKTLDGTIAALGDTWDELFRTVSTNNVGSLIFDSVTLANGALEDATTILRALGGAAQDAGRDTGALSTIQSGLATAFETVAVLGANVAYVLKQTGNEIGGLVAQIAQFAKSGGGAFMLFDVITKGRSVELDAIRSIRREMVADAEEARKQIDLTEKRILGARKAQEEYASYSTRNASAAADPRRVDLSAPRRSGGGSGGTSGARSGGAAASAIKAEQSAYENLITTIKTKIELDKAELAGNAALTESQQMRVKLDEDLAGGRLKLSAIHEKEIRTSLDALGVSEALMKARKLELEQAEAYAKTIESRQISAASVADQIAALQQEAKVSEMVRTMKIGEAEAIEILNIARLREKATIIGLFDPHAQELAYLKDEIEQREKLTGMLGQKRVADTATTAAEAAADEWKKTTESIEASLTDALMRGFESGKSFGENLGDSISNYFKTTVAKEIAAAITRAIMSAMASTQWGQMLSGVLGGGSGDGNWMSMVRKAYQAYSGGGGGGVASLFGGGTAAAGGASAYGSSYAAGSVSTSAMVSTGSTAAASGTASSTMASGGFTGYGYLGYAALIAAAVMIAENLYSKGYTRMAIGEGGSETAKFGQYSSYNTDPSTQRAGAMQNSPAMLMATFDRTMLDALGVSEKLADIFSGTTRMATLVGRKLSAYGYQADIAGGDAEVGGFARYKGGVFRSNKTVKADVDPRDAAAFDAVVENTIEGSKAMARALGLSDDAINQYTGSLKVNFKGAKTAEEQAERMAEAMDELQYSLLKAASGGKYSREEFDKMIEAAQASMAAVGITTEGIADILVQGMTGRLSQADVGDRLSEVIVGGIYNAIASNYAGVIAQAFTSQIITPIFTALAAGVPISQAISQAAINNVVATAQNAAAALNAVFSDPGFRQAIAGIEGAISSVAGSVTKIKVPAYGGRSAKAAAADQSAQQRYQLETQLLTLLGNTTRLRERELAGLSAGNRALQQRIWALEDAKSGVEAAMATLERSIDAQRETVQKQLDAARDAESSINDIFKLLGDSVRGLRGDVESTSKMQVGQARAYLQSAMLIAARQSAPTIKRSLSGQPADSIQQFLKLNIDDLEQATETLIDSIESTNFASQFDSDRARLTLANELDALKNAVEPRLSAAEQAVAQGEAQLTALDSALELAQNQVDALFGVDTSVKSVEAAVSELAVKMAAYAAAVSAGSKIPVGVAPPPPSGGGGGGGRGGGGGGGGGRGSAWTAQGYWNKNPDLQKEFKDANLENSPDFNKDPVLSARDEYLTWHWNTKGRDIEHRKYAAGGYYPGGMALVGEEGPELINFKQPGQVYTARQTADLMRGDGGMVEVVKELRELRGEQRAQASAMVSMQQKLNKIVSRWDATGIPEVRVLA